MRVAVIDSDDSVRALVWRGLVYFSSEPLTGRRLDLAPQLTRSSDSPLELLDQLFGRVRHQASEQGRRSTLTARQGTAVKEIILESARDDAFPYNHRLKMALEEAVELNLDLTLPWLRERLAFIRAGANSGYTQPFPDELHPLVFIRRKRPAARNELERLLDELENPATTGLYRMAVEQAVDWLGADSDVVTQRLRSWVHGDGRQLELAHHYVHSGNWRTFTARARLLLDAVGDTAEVRQSLISSRYPRAFVGGRAPYLRARADEYRRCLRHRDRRLREIAAAAIAQFEQEAEEDLERERREEEAI